eukprot:jgi/Bigna1/79080/fgenesh1_pg.59_\
MTAMTAMTAMVLLATPSLLPTVAKATVLAQTQIVTKLDWLTRWRTHLLSMETAYDTNILAYTYNNDNACRATATAWISNRTAIGCQGNSSYPCSGINSSPCCNDNSWIHDADYNKCKQVSNSQECCPYCLSTSDARYNYHCVISPQSVSVTVCYTKYNDPPAVPLPANYRCSTSPDHTINGNVKKNDSTDVEGPGPTCDFMINDFESGRDVNSFVNLGNEYSNSSFPYGQMDQGLLLMHRAAVANGSMTFTSGVNCAVMTSPKLNGGLDATLKPTSEFHLMDPIVYANHRKVKFAGGKRILVGGGRNEGTIEFSNNVSVSVFLFTNMGSVDFYNCSNTNLIANMTNNATVNFANSSATVSQVTNSGTIAFDHGSHGIYDTANTGDISFDNPDITLKTVTNQGSIQMRGGAYNLDNVINSGSISMSRGTYDLFTLRNSGNVSVNDASRFYVSTTINKRTFINLTTPGNVTVDGTKNSGIVQFYDSQHLIVTNTDNLVDGIVKFTGVSGSFYNLSNEGLVVLSSGHITADTIYNSGVILIKKEVSGSLKVVCNDGNITIENGIVGAFLILPTGITGVTVPAGVPVTYYTPPPGECDNSRRGITATFPTTSYSSLSTQNQNRFQTEFKASINRATDTPLDLIEIVSVADGSIKVNAFVTRPSRQQGVAFLDTVTVAPELIFSEEYGFSVDEFGTPTVTSDTSFSVQINTVTHEDVVEDAFDPSENDVALFIVVLYTTTIVCCAVALVIDGICVAVAMRRKEETRFWRGMNRTTMLRGDTRSCANLKELSIWSLRRRHPWLIACRPKGDFLDSTKRVLVLLIAIINLATITFLLLGTEQKLPGLEGEASAAIVACIVGYPIPFVFSQFFGRKSPKEFSVKHDHGEGLYAELIRWVLFFCPICIASHLELNFEEGADDLEGEASISAFDDGNPGAMGPGSDQDHKIERRTVVPVHFTWASESRGTIKEPFVVNVDDKGQKNDGIAEEDAEDNNFNWTTHDNLGVGVTVLIALGCAMLMCMISWKNEEERAEALSGIFIALAQDAFLRLVTTFGVEMLFVAPLTCCLCCSSSSSAPKSSPDSKDGPSRVGMKELVALNETIMVTVPADEPSFCVKLKTLEVDSVEPLGHSQGIRQGMRVISINNTHTVDAKSFLRTLKYAHATGDVLCFELTSKNIGGSGKAALGVSSPLNSSVINNHKTQRDSEATATLLPGSELKVSSAISTGDKLVSSSINDSRTEPRLPGQPDV